MINAKNTKWSVAIFAHNEADNIIPCLKSVLQQSETHSFPIHVLANGCQDNTVQTVEEFANRYSEIRLVNIDKPDKANAWNHYIHHIAPECECHFFIDGDVEIENRSFTELYDSLIASSDAVAAGGLPASGRSRAAWSQRMLSRGRLAGAFYALHGNFLADIRDQNITIPIGLVGEDFFVTCLAKGELNLNGINYPSPRVVFNAKALFRFKSFSLKNPKHWWTYFNRLIRYQVREYQLLMLFYFMHGRTQNELPEDVQALYDRAGQLPTYRWRGRITPIDMIAVWKIRHATRKSV